MSLGRRYFTKEFKVSVIRENESGRSISELSRKYNIHPTMICRWKRHYRKGPRHSFPEGNNSHSNPDARIAELERLVGQLTMENNVLKKALEKLEQGIYMKKTGEEK